MDGLRYGGGYALPPLRLFFILAPLGLKIEAERMDKSDWGPLDKPIHNSIQ